MKIRRGRRKPKKTIRKIIIKYLNINKLDLKMVYDRMLLCNLIHQTDIN